MSSLASLAASIDTFAENDRAFFDALLAAKDRELGELEAEQAKANAEFDARKQRNRMEREKIEGWGRERQAEITAILEGGA